MKLFIYSFLTFFIWGNSFAQILDPETYSSVIKVACIGNSITYGATISNRPKDSYPSQLGRMLGDKWDVRNFGVSGTTMLKKGNYPYWNESAYAEAQKFLPDVVIIKLGTNDTKSQNWRYGDEFKNDYRAMIQDFKSLKSKPKILLCKPVPVYASKWSINDSIVIHGVIPVVEQLAKEESLPVIDLFAALSAKESLFSDKIHPNAEGAGEIAKAVYKVLVGTDGELVSSEYPGKQSTWHGFARYDFQIDRRSARLVVPKKAAPGNPWVWRARFPDWHYEMDSILLDRGYHIAYINTDDMFGSPNAMTIWNKFYKYLNTQYGLNKKVALEGVSRGGLFVYAFAKQWPERVSSIYAEAPVCDFKSWPGGFGASDGDSKSWERLKIEYGFKTDDQARAWTNQPMDSLRLLANAKIPVLHMIGLNDQVVPPSENTFKLIQQYIELGGPASIVPCTQGKQTAQGHHFPIETPLLGADFIYYHTDFPKAKLPAENYHHMLGNIRNSLMKFERQKKGRVVFLGGSITYNNGWRDSICAYLQTRFPETEFDFISAGIPSMGTTCAAFRLERDVFSNGPVDLLFEEAAVNDAGNGRTDDEQIRGMEGIIRRVREENPLVDIVMMHFVDPDKIKSYQQGEEPRVIRNFDKVARHYNIPTINLAKEVTDRINAGEFTWKDDFKNVHPSPFGQGIYAHSMIVFFDNAWSAFIADDDKITAHLQPEMLDPNSYINGYLEPATEADIKLGKGWSIDENWNPQDGRSSRPNYIDVPMLVGNGADGSLVYKFEGTVVGIAVAAGFDAGVIEYRIDKGLWQKKDLYTQYSRRLHLPKYYTLAAELERKKHSLTIRMADEKNKQSEGRVCRIRYFYVNR
jgi:lysophospholipase L1-like esterase/pimeloyl-ACP methyl ester carboxylesterase